MIFGGKYGDAVPFSTDLLTRPVQEGAVWHGFGRNQLLQVLEGVSDVVYCVDREWRFTYLNSRAEEAWGRRRDALLGRHYWTEFPETVGSESQRRHFDAMTTRLPAHYETVSPALHRPISVSIYPDDGGGLTVLLRHAADRGAAEKVWQEGEVALRRSQESYRLALVAGQIGTWDLDLETGECRCSPRMAELIGLPAAQVTVTRAQWEGAILPEDRAAVGAAVLGALVQGSGLELEYRVVHPDGSEHWLYSRGELSRDEAGEVRSWHGVSLEVTARKRAEEELRASERRAAFLTVLNDALRPLADPMDIQAAAARVLGKHLGASRVFYAEFEPDTDFLVIERDYHADVASVAGRWRLHDFGADVAADLRAGRTLVIRDASRDERMAGPTVRAAYDSAQIQAEVVVPLIKRGRLAVTFSVQQATTRDWTNDEVALVEETAERTWGAVERAFAEAARREVEERFRLVVESIEDYAIVSLDERGRVTSWNRGAARMSGYSETEVLGRHFSMFYPAEALADGLPEREMAKALTTGRSADEGWRVRKGGERFWVNEVMVPLRAGADGDTLLGFAKICCDLSARKALEDERATVLAVEQAARREAETVSRAKDRFLAALSHELRTPLSPVFMSVDLLAAEPSLTPSGRRALAMIERNVDIEARLIEDLLDVSRIIHGKLDLRPAPSELHLCVGRALETCETELKGKSLRLSVVLGARDARVQADAARLQQVFWNLLKNAAKFTPVGGAVTVHSDNPRPGCVRVQIADTGAGIAPELLPRLYKPFEQGESDTVRFGGLGLGLTIAHAIVSAHGGRLLAESAGIGRGATFSVELPTSGRPA